MIEMGKKYKTRDGRDVRIYAVDVGSNKIVHGAIRDGDLWSIEIWTAQGKYREFSQLACRDDLIEVKPERWHPIMAGSLGAYGMPFVAFDSREKALAHTAPGFRAIDAWKEPE